MGMVFEAASLILPTSYIELCLAWRLQLKRVTIGVKAGGRRLFKMLGLIMKMARFRLGQKVARGVAKKLGLRPVASIMGIIGGFKAI